MELVCSADTSGMPDGVVYDVQYFTTDLNRLDHRIKEENSVNLPFHALDDILPKGLNVDVSSKMCSLLNMLYT